ncbi:MAG: hypothetical protein QNJ87_14100 [Gammaproteobacteria bacterium]|nr:hypothetical protein [Gammaproteobacteria bacterium]
MKRPGTMAQYAELIERALIKVDEMRQVMEYETDGGGRPPSSSARWRPLSIA